jgi:hypothetical protein
MPEKPSATLPGTVRKVLQFPNKSEKVEIAIEGPDRLHKEIPIEKSLTDSNGKKSN